MTATYTSTYSVADVEIVMRRFRADLGMIAESSKTLNKAEVNDYASDIEAFAKEGYLSFVDVTLLSGSIEKMAVRYDVKTDTTELTSSRSGGVMWTPVALGNLRIVLRHSPLWYSLDTASQTTFMNRLKIPWGPSYADIGHNTLTSQTARNFVSNGYGLARKDFSS
jgi:hypothetical protein